MALSFKTAELIISTVVTLIAYFLSVSITGYTRAAVASKMGDDTPEQLGFMTLNPMVHASRLWVFFIILFQMTSQFTPIGFGRYIPLTPSHIHGKYRALKTACAYLSDAGMSILIAVFSLLLLIALYGAHGVELVISVISLKNLLAVGSSGVSSFTLVTGWLLVALFSLNTVMAAFNLILNTFHFVVFYYYGDVLKKSEHGDLIIIFGPLVFFYLMFFFLSDFVKLFVIYIAYLLGFLMGVL